MRRKLMEEKERLSNMFQENLKNKVLDMIDENGKGSGDNSNETDRGKKRNLLASLSMGPAARKNSILGGGGGMNL